MRRPLSLAARALGVLVCALAVLVSGGLLAAAHDQLLKSNPADGSTIDAAPERVELTFSGVPIPIGSQVLVEDAEGRDWAFGDLRVVDTVVSRAINPAAPPGTYTVRWRVVSSDGHPVSGTVEYTTRTGGEPLPDEGEDSAADEASTTAAAPGPDEPGQTDSAEGGPWLVVGIVGAVVIGLGALLGLMARARRRSAGPAG